MIYGYAFVKQLQAANLLVEESSVEAALSQLQLFASVEDQTQFYENFLEESSATGKLMRKYIQNKNKPPKAEKKPRAPRKKAVKVEDEEGKEGESGEKPAPKARKPRAKKSVTVVNDTENNIIGQLVAAAQNDEPVAPVVAEKEKKPRKKAEPKTKAVVADTPAVADTAPVAVANVEVEVKETVKPKEKKASKKATVEVSEGDKKEKKTSKKAAEPKAPVEVSEEDKKEKKPRKKAEPKAKIAPVVEPVVPQELAVTNELVNEPIAGEDDDEDEIHTREFVLNGVTYLLDEDNNVYSVDESHDHIGVYNPSSKKIESV
jgi:hypothetical protein